MQAYSYPVHRVHPNGTLELLDAQGRLISQLPVSGIMAEVDVKELDNGLYLARLIFEGMQVSETKFTVQQ